MSWAVAPEVSMKRNRRLDAALNQFSYNHAKLDGQAQKIRKSARELSKLLDNMGSKNEEKKEK